MQDNVLHNNPFVFWAGLVLFFIGLLGMVFYLFVRTATETALLPGPHFRLKHFTVALLIAVAGAVVASFARPRGSAMSDTTAYNR
jgi:hypothetical protein